MIDPFGYDKMSDEDIENRFQQTLKRCNKEVDILVNAIDNIDDAMRVMKDSMTCIEYKALRKTVLQLVAEKLEFSVSEID